MELYQLDIGIWATIFSYLNPVDFHCLEFDDILKNVGLWTELIRQRFPEWYVPSAVGFAYKELYRQMVKFDDFKNQQNNLRCDPHYFGLSIEYELNKYKELQKYLITNKLLDLNEKRVKILIFSSNLELDLIKRLFDAYPPNHKLLKNILKHYLHKNIKMELEKQVQNYDTRHDIFKYILNYKCDLVEITKDDLIKILDSFFCSSEDLEAMYYKINEDTPAINENTLAYDLNELYTRLKFMLKSNLFSQNIQYMLRDYPDKFEKQDISVKNLILVLENSFRTNKYPFILEVYKRSKHLLSPEDIKELTQLFLNINRLHLNHDLDDDSLSKMSLDELLISILKMIKDL